MVYRIDKEKLEQYHSQFKLKHNHEWNSFNEKKIFYGKQKKRKSLMSIIKILFRDIIGNKMISKQIQSNQMLHSSMNLIDSFVNASSVISESKRSICLSSLSDSSHDIERITTKKSSSLINLSNLDNTRNKKTSMITVKSNPMENYQFKNYFAQLQSKNCRIYVRSIGQNMLDEAILDENSF